MLTSSDFLAVLKASIDGSHPISSKPANCSLASEWLSAAEAADYLKIKVRTLLLWVRQGKVKGHALSGSQRHVWRFRRDELDAAFFYPDRHNVLPSFSSSVRSAEREADK